MIDPTARRKSGKTARSQKRDTFTKEERAAMKERAREPKAGAGGSEGRAEKCDEVAAKGHEEFEIRS